MEGESSASPNTLHHLKPIGGAGVDGPVLLGPTTTLGRAETNTVRIRGQDHASVSAHHARIQLSGGVATIEDLGSTHGLLVNGIRTRECRLEDGDILELGANGPRFLYEARSQGQHTGPVRVPPGTPGRPDLSNTAIVRVKQALGVPAEQSISGMFQQTERRTRGRLLKVGLVLCACIGIAWIALKHEQQVQWQQWAASMDSRLDGVIAKTSETFERQHADYESQKELLRASRDALEKRVQELSETVPVSDLALLDLRKKLEAAEARLKTFDPVNVERAREADIDRVRKTVVCIEVSMRLKDPATGRLLRRIGDEASLSDEGEPMERPVGSGTGFTIQDDGLVLTNAHVVDMSEHNEPVETPLGALQPEWVYHAVFSGTSLRHPAKVVKQLGREENDLALVRIQPFPGMPFLAKLSTDAPRPQVGAEVYLHGFPLGRRALQDGATLYASSFRGILSRNLKDWMQVDAAVHPGNSGGPVTDNLGNVIGIATSVQILREETIAPEMGYVIPIGTAKRLVNDYLVPSADPKLKTSASNPK